MNDGHWDRIYLSPHLDDAALSCGGLIYQQTHAGERVLVVTLFAGSPPDDEITPFARELKARWGGATDPVAVRRREDLAAWRALGAEGLHLPYYDCVYRSDPRTGEAYYPDVASIFADLHPAERDWRRELLAALRERVADLCAARIVAPLTVGHHVDHILAQQMALELMRQGCDVRFYEDYPYAGDAEAIGRALAPWPRGCWSVEAFYLNEAALAAKGDAVACHASQISTFWPDVDAMRRALRAQALAVGEGRYAERLWRLDPRCLPRDFTTHG